MTEEEEEEEEDVNVFARLERVEAPIQYMLQCVEQFHIEMSRLTQVHHIGSLMRARASTHQMDGIARGNGAQGHNEARSAATARTAVKARFSLNGQEPIEPPGIPGARLPKRKDEHRGRSPSIAASEEEGRFS